MDTDVEQVDFRRHADELRASWQVKVLLAAQGKDFAVILSMLAHSFDDAMPVLLRVAFPGFRSITAPFLGTAGKINKRGRVCADVITSDGQIYKQQPLYASEEKFQNAIRRLADRLKLDDGDRIELFKVAQRWVVCDYRLDPNMNPADPDAKRLTIN